MIGSHAGDSRYFVANCRLTQFATVLQMRCGRRDDPHQAAAVQRFLRADRSVSGLAWLWLRARRERSGRPETLGGELGLLAGFLWRRALGPAGGPSVREGACGWTPCLPATWLPDPERESPPGPRTRGAAESDFAAWHFTAGGRLSRRG